jgi:hypothetical protein
MIILLAPLGIYAGIDVLILLTLKFLVHSKEAREAEE